MKEELIFPFYSPTKLKLYFSGVIIFTTVTNMQILGRPITHQCNHFQAHNETNTVNLDA